MNEETKKEYQQIFGKTVESVIEGGLSYYHPSVTKEQLSEEIELRCEMELKWFHLSGIRSTVDYTTDLSDFEKTFHSNNKLHVEWYNKKKLISDKYKDVRYQTMWERSSIRLEDYNRLSKQDRKKWNSRSK